MAIIICSIVCVTSQLPLWHGFHLLDGADAKYPSVPTSLWYKRSGLGHTNGKDKTREQRREFG